MTIDPGKEFEHFSVADLPKLINPGDVVVANNTKVFPARFFGQKESGGNVEVLIERLVDDRTVRAFIRASKAPGIGAVLKMKGGFLLTVDSRRHDLFVLRTEPSVNILEMANKHGHTPLPPYIKRKDTIEDRRRYQTVFAKDLGSVAAPTAGLHLDWQLINSIVDRKATWCEITLHVGAGTFAPVRVDNIEEHKMHSEYYKISENVVDKIKQAKANGSKIIAVGTTTLRCLEGVAASNRGKLKAGSGETSIFITPGYEFAIVDQLLTNFHLPESTLMMLVTAFGGYSRIMAAYQSAVKNKYRFFSYGDACLITRDPMGCVSAS